MSRKLFLFLILSNCSFFAISQMPSFTTSTNLLSTVSGFTQEDCVVDMNGDYLDDVVRVTSSGTTIDYQLPNGDFSNNFFNTNHANNPSWSIAAGDIDGNGYNDLIYGGTSGVTFIKANSDGTNYITDNQPEYIFTQRTTFFDIDNDGDLDAFACHDIDESHPYRNDGNGNMTLDQNLIVTADMPGNYAAIWVDYDNDGDSDLYITKCRIASTPGDVERTNLLYRNDNNGIFTEVGAIANLDDNAQSWATIFEDFDNDGDFDAFIVNHDFKNRFMRNNGDGTFTDIIDQTNIFSQDLGSWENSAADFNNDGYMDIFSEMQRELYINNGNMTFTGIDLPFRKGAIGDLNNDGFLDVVRSSTAYLNDGNGNNWVKINTRGTVSNRNGIGARVEIYGSWGMQIREVRSGESFSPMHSLTTHFGIGTASSIDSLVIKWPSGIQSVLENPEINTTHLITEPCFLEVADITVNGNATICEGEITNLTAPIGYTYLWSTGETENAIEVAETGTYEVTISDGSNCAAIKTQNIIVNPTPIGAIVVPNNTPVICEGQSINLSASGGIDYQWNTAETGDNIIVNETDNYEVTITDNNGCLTVAIQEITVNALPNATITAVDDVTTFCEGNSTTLVASGGVNYSWNNQENTDSIEVMNADIYTVIVTDENGCINTAQQQIIVHALPTAAIEISEGTASFCIGTSAELTATGGDVVAWNTNATSDAIMVSETNDYSVIIMNENGCTNTAIQSILVNELPIADIEITSGDAAICVGETAILTASGGDAYEWNTTAINAEISVTETADYSVVVTDGNGCTNTAFQSILVNELPIADIEITSGDAAICVGETATLTASDGDAYEWNTMAIDTEISVTETADYSVVVTDVNGCTNTAFQSILVNELPIADIEITSGDAAICVGETATLTASGGDVYEWNTMATDTEISVTETADYSVVVTDVNGCTNTAFQSILVNELPIAEIEITSGDAAICAGETATLTASGGDIYEWNTMAIDAAISVTETADYSVVVTDGNGCTNTAFQSILVNELPAVDIEITSGDAAICAGETAILTASGGDAYEWNTMAIDAEISVTETADYSVVVTDGNGCTNTAFQSVLVNELPIAEIEITAGTSAFCDGESAILTASGGVNYQWQTEEITAFITATTSDTYAVTITDMNGCTNETNQAIEVFALPEIPNIVTYNLANEVYLVIEQEALQNGFTYEWFYNGEWMEAVDGYEIPCPEDGVYQVQITDTNGCQSMSEAFTTMGCLVATQELDFIQKMRTYPNPTQAELNLHLIFSEAVFLKKWTIHTITGQSVISKNINAYFSEYNTMIDVSSLVSGVYLIELILNGKRQYLKFIKE